MVHRVGLRKRVYSAEKHVLARRCAIANKDANENQNQIERDPEIERCTFAKVATRNEQT